MRTPIIAGNWKMNLLVDEGKELVQEIWGNISGLSGVDVVVCPPFVDIPSVANAIHEKEMSIELGAQNMHWEESGAYTGEVSPLMLKDLGVKYVIIGHSERRQFFGETDQGVNRKVKSALAHRLVPIMCVGESLKEREAGQTEEVTTGQVKRGMFELSAEEASNVVIAYEPIWAIGTGKSATAGDAEKVISGIRETVLELFGKECSQRVRIQYGGSVTPENIADFMAMENIDGGLVGGASLKADSFSEILRRV